MKRSVSVHIIYDNKASSAKFEKGWGFSCLVRHHTGRNVLFDTGDDPERLRHNLAEKGISPAEVDDIVLSHDHWDHNGGLDLFFSREPVSRGDRRFFCGNSCYERWSRPAERAGFLPVRVGARTPVTQGIAAGPQMEGMTGPDEIALSVECAQGLALVTGCAHPGILRMVKENSSCAGVGVHMVLGGFHLKDAEPHQARETAELLRKAGVRTAGPCHCTGEMAEKVFQEVFKRSCLKLSAGWSCDLELM